MTDLENIISDAAETAFRSYWDQLLLQKEIKAAIETGIADRISEGECSAVLSITDNQLVVHIGRSSGSYADLSVDVWLDRWISPHGASSPAQAEKMREVAAGLDSIMAKLAEAKARLQAEIEAWDRRRLA